ncbi:ABC-three component system protein [Paenibacillus sp. sgz500992]|uniref:ABC-three component system protein n=1 Tax=Paenibacillus sp. sgz500992 TaxID=3242476 RepID=UPI0036D2107E
MDESTYSSPKKNIVLFLHGFTSGNATWESDGLTLPDLLLKDDEIKNNFDMAYVDYYTKIADFKEVRAGLNIFKMLFKNRSTYVPINNGVITLGDFVYDKIFLNYDDYENIIITGHSMGGLIAKYCILENIERYGSNQKIKLFLSLSTPHMGSNWGALGKNLFNNKQIIDLAPLSDTLDELNRDWHDKQEVIPRTIYFYGKDDLVVNENSAVAYGAEKSDIFACDDDHFSITKPDRFQKNTILAIKKELIKFIHKVNMETSLEIKKLKDGKSLDNEIFAIKLLIADVHSGLVEGAKESFFNAEYATRALLAQGITQEKLDSLYVLIHDVYIDAFSKLCSNEIKDSNALVREVKNQIRDNNDTFLSATETHKILNAYHKNGMLQQLANNFDEDIWWAKGHNIKNFEELRRNKSL